MKPDQTPNATESHRNCFPQSDFVHYKLGKYVVYYRRNKITHISGKPLFAKSCTQYPS